MFYFSCEVSSTVYTSSVSNQNVILTPVCAAMQALKQNLQNDSIQTEWNNKEQWWNTDTSK